MEILVLVLLVAAAVCFLLAAFALPTRAQLVPAGMLCWVAAVIVVWVDGHRLLV